MISFTWYDLIVFFLMMAMPVIAGIAILVLICSSFKNLTSRHILLWLVLPQCVALLSLWGVFTFYGDELNSRIFLIVSPAILAGILAFWLLYKGKTLLGSSVGGHLVAIAIFFVCQNQLEPQLYVDFQRARDINQLYTLHQASDSFKNQLSDPAFRQKMLSYSAYEQDMPESTFRILIASGANPFDNAVYPYVSPLTQAVNSQNKTALKVFSELLSGDSEQAARNREALMEDNPLSNNVYFSAIPTTEQKQRYFAMATVLLRHMPSLLNDEVYRRILKEGDAELTQFLWNHRQPIKRMYQLQARALSGDVTIADDIAATPAILKAETDSDYRDQLLKYLVEYAPRPVIQAILDKDVVQWTDFDDRDGNNKVLEEAIDRARGYSNGDPQVLTLVIRDILERKAPYSDNQLAHGFYTEDKGSQVVSALHAGGISCTELRDAFRQYIGESSVFDGKARIDEVCGAEK
ncbi:hypothetical protein OGV94_04700 [Citrobacter sp. Ce006]|uniref:hypothetical protein n=1 Tax=Citrobacter sp. Ce006 TaxID=2985039 RepID=UPI002578436C|nr:hypothetical protein [Citrobacter sp. Ce006]MDM3317576.1 hypothetical protein [Citrobacter sp. Ce006]